MQSVVENALAVVLRLDSGPRLTVAGRTDAGVHALGQVASYSGEPAPLDGLNALLPDDVAVLSCSPAAEGFDARRDATSRAYCYRVLARSGRGSLEQGRALWWPHPVEFSVLEECAALLIGAHDFTAFTPTETEHVRFSREVFAAYWDCSDDVLSFKIEADAFMRHMNRVLVGTMLEVAGASRPLESFASLLSGAQRPAAGPTAPPHGLYLVGVGYQGERVLSGQRYR